MASTVAVTEKGVFTESARLPAPVKRICVSASSWVITSTVRRPVWGSQFWTLGSRSFAKAMACSPSTVTV